MKKKRKKKIKGRIAEIKEELKKRTQECARRMLGSAKPTQ